MPFLLANSLAKQRENRGIKRQNAFAQSCAKNAKNVGKSKKKALFKGFCVVEVTGFEHVKAVKNCLKYNTFTIH